MSLLSKLAQSYITTKYKKRPQTRADLYNEQNKVFQKYKKSLKGTEIYDYLQLDKIRNYQDFTKMVTPKDYESFRPFIEKHLAGNKDVMFKDKPLFVSLTSGTTGNSKKIPHNQASIDVFLQAQKHIIAGFAEQVEDFNILNTKRIGIGSIPEVYRDNRGVRHGYMSGILNEYSPKIIQKNIFPSKEALMLSDWHDKVEAIAAETIDEDINFISGIPSYVVSFFEYVKERTGVETLDKVWPNLTTYVFGATAIDHFRDRIDALFGRPLYYLGTYAASEAAIGYSVPRSDGLVRDYVFIPNTLVTFTDVENTNLHFGLHELEEGRDYFLNISMPNGMLNYQMKDILNVVQVDGELRYHIKGRQATGVSFTGERSSDIQLSNAVMRVKEKFDIDIKHFMVCPKEEGGKVFYQWTLFMDDLYLDANQSLGPAMDEALSHENELYKYARHDGIFQVAKATVVSYKYIEDYFLKNQSKGQLKMKTSFKTQDDFNNFISNEMQGLSL